MAKLIRLLPVSSEKIGPRDYTNIKDWITAHGSNKYGATCQEIYPATQIRLSPPKTIDKEIHWAYEEESGSWPPAFVAEIPDGRLWGDKWCVDGTVITPDNRTLEEFSFQTGRKTKDNSVFNRWPMPPLHRLDGMVADLTAMASGYVYFHWMFDVLPRVHLLQKSGLFDRIDHFIVNRYSYPYQKETLSALGIPEEKIIQNLRFPYIKADRVIAPSLLGHRGHMPKWACNFLRETFLKSNQASNEKPKRRIYISREDSPGRRIINEKEVFDFLEGFGFEKYILTGKPVAEQVKLFSSAEAIIAIHGSSLTNIVFCDKGTKIIEIYSPTFIETWHWLISCQLGLDFYYLISKGKRLTRDKWHKRDKGRNMLLDIGDLGKTLELAGIKKHG